MPGRHSLSSKQPKGNLLEISSDQVLVHHQHSHHHGPLGSTSTNGPVYTPRLPFRGPYNLRSPVSCSPVTPQVHNLLHPWTCPCSALSTPRTFAHMLPQAAMSFSFLQLEKSQLCLSSSLNAMLSRETSPSVPCPSRSPCSACSHQSSDYGPGIPCSHTSLLHCPA